MLLNNNRRLTIRKFETLVKPFLLDKFEVFALYAEYGLFGKDNPLC